ncbi:MAG: gliding motility-associated C-terminal domain-containing protein [Saprospiraceae bacterium]|nr:gliding motility-associated C-terminal domain-containing protein [Saprospiraceae bacterium]MCB9356481.1 gliding motility-associated C-terminal domain-containing protein [Lewinellaceae bacterium]
MFHTIEKTLMRLSARLRLLLSPIMCLPLAAMASEMPTDTSYIRDTFCSTQILLIGNQLFDPSHPDDTVILPGASFDGSDSVLIVDLEFRQPAYNKLTLNLCAGDTIWVNGTAYHDHFYLGQETVEGGAANGCDSIIDIELTFYPNVLEYNSTICEGDTIYINGTAYHAFHSSGEERIPGGASMGCDSIIQVDLEVLTPPYFILKDTLCPDEVLVINGHRYDRNNRTGLEILPGAASTGCDSLLYLELVFRQLWVFIGDDREVVKGDSICLTPQFGLAPSAITWNPPLPCQNPDCSTVCTQVLSPALYQITVTDTNGCQVNDEIRISVSDDNRVFAPNVFNPDAGWPDNRFFLSADNGVSIIRHLMIANRWGEVVFDVSGLAPDDPTSGWDGTWNGKTAQVGVYAFWAEMERLDGSTFTKTGTVTLVR